MRPTSSPLSAPSYLRAVILLSCLLSQVPLAQSAICYGTTGLQSDKKFPCEPDAEVSACCDPGDICFSNGLCSPSQALKDKKPKGFYLTPFFWGACSDPTYKDPKCFSACFTNPGNGVQSCPEAGPNAYCCFGYSGCDCSDPDQVVTAIAGSIVATIDFDVTSARSTTSRTTSSTATSTHTSSTTSSTDTPSSTSASKDSTATTAEPEAITTTNTSQDQGDQETKSSALPIGVGVGVGVVVLIAIAAATFFFLRRRRQKAQEAPHWGGPELKYEKQPDETHYEMMAGYNAAELSSGVPLHELPAPR
ncbi:hypothetical protein V498_10676 [Pseudogymnoascus sp. VKM F-4517 (FW-2822)]|nr:hypothetical protein V498_10676 [Pseudogymnoascus sp. VKM F-4517 (FW-2822)]